MWKNHYDSINQTRQPPAATLQKALSLMEKGNNRNAIDLGCGNGVDSLAILAFGLELLAIDNEIASFEYLKNVIPVEYNKMFQFSNTSFEKLQTLPSSDLINASFSLPFCHPDHFNILWQKITKSLRPSGFFCGHLFGYNDSWSSSENMTFHTLNDVHKLLKDFEIIKTKEIQRTGKTLSGKEKFWHVYHIVAQKH